MEKPFLVTTENQRYLEQTGAFSAKRAFCILGGGETVISLAAAGVFSITAIDINKFQMPVFALKEATLNSLDNKGMESFVYDASDRNFLAYDVFSKISSSFKEGEEDYKNFWEYMISVHKEDLRDAFFKGGAEGVSIDKVRMAIPFIKRRGVYLEARENLKKAKVIQVVGDAIQYLLSHSEEKFDYIDLTNILCYIYEIQCGYDTNNFKDVIEQLEQIYQVNLNEGGTIVFDYLFRTNIDSLKKHSSFVLWEIYAHIYEELNKKFAVSHFSVPNIIPFYESQIPTDMIIMKKKI